MVQNRISSMELVDEFGYALHQHRVEQPKPASSLGLRRTFSDINAGILQNDYDLIVTNTHAIREQIANVLTVIIGEEHFEPTFGSLLSLRLFEPAEVNAGVTVFKLEGDTIEALEEHMSGVIVLRYGACYIDLLEDEEGYTIHIEYDTVDGSINDAFDIPMVRFR